jgi:membrane protein implicated in regulation of membrane protease activity
MSWLVWLIAAAILGVAEALTLTFALGILAAGAVVAAIVAGVGAPLLLQVLAFGAASAFGLIVIRPIARRHMSQSAITREGSDALIGKNAVVLREVSVTGGLIKLAGEEWSARPLDENQVIPAGAMVDVMEIDGATAVVYPRNLLP